MSHINDLSKTVMVMQTSISQEEQNGASSNFVASSSEQFKDCNKMTHLMHKPKAIALSSYSHVLWCYCDVYSY